MRYLSEEIRPLLERRELLELVLVDGEGMVLDAEGGLFPPEKLAALFSPFHRLLDSLRRELPLEKVEEISFRTLGPRLRVILQSFSVSGNSFLLIALFPVTTFYRQVTADILGIVKETTRKLTHPHQPPEEGPGRSGTGASSRGG